MVVPHVEETLAHLLVVLAVADVAPRVQGGQEGHGGRGIVVVLLELLPHGVDDGELLALLLDELAGFAAAEAARVLAEVPLEEEGHAGAAHGDQEDEGALDHVEHLGDVAERGEVQQGEREEEPPNRNNKQKLDVEVKTGKKETFSVIT